MAVYQHLRTSVAGRIPTAGELVAGQIAINLADKKLFTKDDAGNVIALGVDTAYTLPIATASALGGVMVGAGLAIDEATGVLSATGSAPAQASSSVAGVVKVGANLAIDAGTGVLSADLSSVVPETALGANSGVATLDSTGKLTAAQIPASLVGAVVYQGAWDASANSPAIPAAAAGNKGQYYIVGTAGTTAIDGHASWSVGDWIVSDGTKWDYIDNSVAAAYQLPSASAGTKGGVTVAADSGLAVDANGALTVGTVDAGTF
jgi:hypothetical protein